MSNTIRKKASKKSNKKYNKFKIETIVDGESQFDTRTVGKAYNLSNAQIINMINTKIELFKTTGDLNQLQHNSNIYYKLNLNQFKILAALILKTNKFKVNKICSMLYKQKNSAYAK